ncbi:D-alanine--D-alanine ligase family protein [Emticicia fontis]
MNSFNLSELCIVLIADRTYESYILSDIEGNKLEMISNEYYDSVFNALKSICKEVIHYQSPEKLIDNAFKHKNDLVLTIFGGSDSRNRMALIPAICESYNIKYVGADVYARVVCQDKFLGKEFAKRFELQLASGVLIDNLEMLPFIKDLKLPLVVKPNFEGSSIGITENSKVNSYEEAIELAKHLFERFNQSILVEEFIAGREVYICIVGNKSKIILLEAMEVVFNDDEDYLIERIYSAKDKHLSEKSNYYRPVTHLLSQKEIQNLESLFLSLGKMDFMRIDGRITDSGFVLIELTPDAYIGNDSSIAYAAKMNNLSYMELFKTIIHTALESYHTPYSNYKEN